MNRREFLAGASAFGIIGAVRAADRSDARSEVERMAMSGSGLVRVKPHVQLLDDTTLGVGWVTSRRAAGWVEWRQRGEVKWKMAWQESDGLRVDAGHMVHRIEIRGYDPSLPFEYRVCSRALAVFEPYRVTYAGDTDVIGGSLPARTGAGKVSFVMLNDVHCRLDVYPALLAHLGGKVDLTILNGDIMSSVTDVDEINVNLLAPLAYVTANTKAPCRFVRGNHELRGQYARRLREHLPLQDGRFYGALTIGGVRFAFLDTGEDKYDGHKELFGLTDFDAYVRREIEWLKGEVASEAWHGACARIVVMHIPTSSNHKGKYWKPGLRRMEELEAVLAKANVTLALAAHQHERENNDPGDGRPYPQIIGGGPDLRAKDPIRLPTLTRVDVKADGIDVSQIDSTGSVVARRHIDGKGRK